LFFVVNPKLVSKAIGPAAENIKKLQAQVGKKIKIIKEADGITDCKRFIESIVSPVKFKSLEIKDNTVVITAGNNQNKASLIGRDKRRFAELKKIIQDVFSLELKIV